MIGKFGGYFDCEVDGDLYITKVIVNKPAFIVLWSDGTKTTAKCNENDDFDGEKGLLLCVMKKIMGSEWVCKLLGDWAIEGNGSWELKDVRKYYKFLSKTEK